MGFLDELKKLFSGAKPSPTAKVEHTQLDFDSITPADPQDDSDSHVALAEVQLNRPADGPLRGRVR